MSQPEPHAVAIPPVGRQVSVAHQRAEHHLELLLAEPMRFGGQHSVTGDEIARLRPATRGADEVIGCRGELRPAVAARLLDRELQEVLGRSVVEPVHHLAGHDLIGHRVVGQHLDIHLVVDDLADLLGGAVGQLDPSAIGITHPNITPIFSRSWLMKIAVVPELLRAPVIFRSA